MGLPGNVVKMNGFVAGFDGVVKRNEERLYSHGVPVVVLEENFGMVASGDKLGKIIVWKAGKIISVLISGNTKPITELWITNTDELVSIQEDMMIEWCISAMKFVVVE